MATATDTSGSVKGNPGSLNSPAVSNTPVTRGSRALGLLIEHRDAISGQSKTLQGLVAGGGALEIAAVQDQLADRERGAVDVHTQQHFRERPLLVEPGHSQVWGEGTLLGLELPLQERVEACRQRGEHA